MSQIIRLVSNVNTFETNTVANFVTQLSNKLILQGQWEVAILEVSYYKTWYNVQKSYIIRLVDEKGTFYNTENDQNLRISEGFYDNDTHLIDEINNVLKTVKNIKPPILKYNILNKICSIEAGEGEKNVKIYPVLGDEVEDILGLKNRFIENNYYNVHENIIFDVFNGNDMFRNGVFKGYHPVQLMGNFHSLYFYSNIVVPTFVGNTTAQLLRIVDVLDNKKFGQLCTICYERPQYVPVMGNEIDLIEIAIKDDTGNLLPFRYGRVRIDLHFRKSIKGVS